jgi:pimeloyl-ACP methyl ester carboxylesterase
MSYRHLKWGIAAILACACWYLYSTASNAAEVTLKDGTTFKGARLILESTVGMKAVKSSGDESPNKCIIKLEEAGAVRVYVPKLQAASTNMENDLKAADVFRLPFSGRVRENQFDSVGGKIQEQPFNAAGIRLTMYNSTLSNGANKPLKVMQQITELHPKYIKVAAIDYLWEFGLPTSSLPAETLHTLLRRAARPDTADSRFAIVRFCLEGGFYPLAQSELVSIAKDFPIREKDVQDYSLRLKQYLADEAVRILEERRQAGQPEFAQQTARKFLSLDLHDVSAATTQTLRKAVASGDEILSRMEESRQLMGQLQAELPPADAAAVAPIRKSIAEELNVDTLDRLEAFRNLADAENRKPSEKLALALSGWVLGSDQAVTDLRQSLRLWQARRQVEIYLRAENSPERAAALEVLEKIEGAGHKQIVRMLALIPPRLETLDAKPGVPYAVEVPAAEDDGEPTRYDVLLPPEYQHGRAYPVVVALHAAGKDPRVELGWWAGRAQRLGYIVVVPQFCSKNQREYDYSVRAHRAVLDSIRDVKRRFTVDSNRVFLGGHGMGGDASFDIGFSHPDLFAGVMPISATLEKFSNEYLINAKTLPVFMLTGELDRDCLRRNTPAINKMMEQHYPVILAVFVGRGYEPFLSEDERLYDWMSRQVRAPLPTKIDVKTVRKTDNQFWWWTFSNFPEKFGLDAWPETKKAHPQMMRLSATAAKAKGDNVLNLSCAARSHALWLFPEVVSFEKPLTIRQGEHQLFKDIPEPNISASLEDFRLRADRQRIAWAYLEVGADNARPMANFEDFPGVPGRRTSRQTRR